MNGEPSFPTPRPEGRGAAFFDDELVSSEPSRRPPGERRERQRKLALLKEFVSLNGLTDKEIASTGFLDSGEPMVLLKGSVPTTQFRGSDEIVVRDGALLSREDQKAMMHAVGRVFTRRHQELTEQKSNELLESATCELLPNPEGITATCTPASVPLFDGFEADLRKEVERTLGIVDFAFVLVVDDQLVIDLLMDEDMPGNQ